MHYLALSCKMILQSNAGPFPQICIENNHRYLNHFPHILYDKVQTVHDISSPFRAYTDPDNTITIYLIPFT